MKRTRARWAATAARIAVLAAVLSAWDGGGAAASPSFTVRATDAQTGAEIPEVAFAIVRGDGDVLARNCVNEYDGDRPVAAGDTVIVFALGYDATRMRLDDGSLHRLELKLVPATLSARLESRVEGDIRDRLQALVKHYLPDPNDDSVLLLLQEHTVEFPGDWVEIRVPRGLNTVAYMHGALSDHVWPIALSLTGGEVVQIHSEQMRDVPLLLEPDERRPLVLTFPTYDVPGTWAPERVDALMRRLLGEIYVANRGGVLVCTQVPPIDFHLYLSGERGRAYRLVDAEASEVDLRGGFPQVVFQGPVRVGGDVVPDGALLAPGRLGLDTIAQLQRLPLGKLGFVARTPLAGTDPVTLAQAAIYTLWHPDRGIAYGQASNGQVRWPVWEPGTVTVRSRSGALLSGRCTLWQTVRGTGSAMVGFFDDVWVRTGTSCECLRFTGVPTGLYRMNLELTPEGAAEPVRVVNSIACPVVEITADDPHGVVFID